MKGWAASSALVGRGAKSMRKDKPFRTAALRILLAGCCFTVFLPCMPARCENELRRTMILDGQWELGEGGMEKAPERFAARVPVPGLVDMAAPPFAEAGVKSDKREAFWYRRVFQVDEPLPAVAVLKIHKAMFGTRALLNGKPLGDHPPSFTPALLDARPALKSGANELLIRVGAFRTSTPKPVPDGWDYEKKKFIPGIFDSVELLCSGAPHILRVQTVPDLENKAVGIHVWLRHAGVLQAAKVHLTIIEAAGGRAAGEGDCEVPVAGDGAESTGRATIALNNCRLWSPEDPFLYEVQARSAGDCLKARFGMRTFRLDRATGRAVLNGRPYFLRGSNVTLYRFFEDAERGDKPWREDWVRRLHKAFRGMHWNSLRYCIGFPPELWYRIADEEGLLIQDEFPIWNMQPKAGDFEAGELAQEYAEWMQERWNHPCVVIWDACNETRSPETAKAIIKVRGLDFSNRPWDNGWSPPAGPDDCFESHPYHFQNPNYKLAMLASANGILGGAPPKNPIIINEYGWLWLNRDGTPTTLTQKLYTNLLGPKSTTEQRRHLYARYLAAETEFWRCRRACAGVLHFCAVGYSRADGQTSDHWANLENLTWEPEFFAYVRDAFAPVGIMVDAWAEQYPAGQAHAFPVVVINDLHENWSGKVRFRLLRDGNALQEESEDCEVAALADRKLVFTVEIPLQGGQYQVEAALVPLTPTLSPTGRGQGEGRAPPVRSLRDFQVMTEEERQARMGLALGKQVKASSSIAKDGATAPEAITDGRADTRWSSEFSDAQWVAVDLGKSQRVARVEIDWEAACAAEYALEISQDGEAWKEVYRTAKGQGGTEVIRLGPLEARWVRMRGIRRATEYGYSIWELRVFGE